MIPNHKQFIEAIQEKKKVSLRLYSKADSGVIDLACAPLDYGPGAGIPDGVNRYSLWDYTSNNGSHILSLLPEQELTSLRQRLPGRKPVQLLPRSLRAIWAIAARSGKTAVEAERGQAVRAPSLRQVSRDRGRGG